MKNDLISRSALLELLKSGAIEFEIPMPESHVDTVKRVLEALYEKLEKTIKEQPTTYSVEKVVERLEEQIDNNRGWEDEDYYWGETKGYEHAIEIVRNGGKE